MPPLSLVVCLRDERDLLERLLTEVAGNYDDLVVIHDGPDTFGVQALVERYQGRFYARPREFQQEPHWPFAWAQAAHDWILRIDADEYPGAALQQWLRAFRASAEPDPAVSGYTCIWPLWNGHRPVTRHWPAGRIFLFHRQRVRFFGMAEQVPVPDGKYERLDLVLEHRPRRSSYGLRNVLLRAQAKRWRTIIARALIGQPADLPRWRWEERGWPPYWSALRSRPVWAPLRRLPIDTLRALREQWRCERKLFPIAAISGPLHHFLIGCAILKEKRKTPGPPPSSSSLL